MANLTTNLGHDTPAILPTDSGEEIRAKLDAALARTREDLLQSMAKAEKSGTSAKDGYCPSVRFSVPVAYVDDRSADNIMPTLQIALATVIGLLESHDLVLVDVLEWRNTMFGSDGEPNDLGHTIGVFYRIHLVPVEFADKTYAQVGVNMITGHAKFLNGELSDRGELRRPLGVH